MYVIMRLKLRASLKMNQLDGNMIVDNIA